MGSRLWHGHSHDYDAHLQMLEFCRDTQQDLSNFEADGVSCVHRSYLGSLSLNFFHTSGVAERYR
jgi:hypothetical protein